MTISGKPKKEQVYLAFTLHCPPSAKSKLVVVMMPGFGGRFGVFLITPKPKISYF